MAEADDNPYVGPRPFERGDRALFFGRDAEARELVSLVVSERVVLLYAASGAGKTSLLHAGVVPLLEEEEQFEVLPVARIRAGLPDELLAGVLNVYTAGVLAALVADDDGNGPDGELGRLTLAAFLARRPHGVDEQRLAAPRALVIDQFEELFTLYPRYWRQREQFVRDIADALAADPLLRVVLAIREDYVAQLDPLSPLFPRELRARFRLERLGPDDAIAAVVNPTGATSRSYAPGVAEKLVADLLRFRIDTGRGESVEIEGEYVEPVQLEVACQNLWNGLPADVTEITEDHLRTFGDVDEVLRRFYDKAVRAAAMRARVPEARARSRVEDSFITSVGTRNTVYRKTDATAGLPNDAVDELENRRVIRAEWRAGTRWYELTHDRLIAPIQSSNARFRARLARKRRRRAMAGLGALAVALALLGATWLVASDNSSIAEGPTAASVKLSLGTPRLGAPATRFATMDIAVSTTGLRGEEVQILASVFDRRDRRVVGPNLQASLRPITNRPPPDAAPVKVPKPMQAGIYEIEIEAQMGSSVMSRRRSKRFVIDSQGVATLPGSRSLKILPAGPGTVAAHLGGSMTQQYCPPFCSLSFSVGQKVKLTASPTGGGGNVCRHHHRADESSVVKEKAFTGRGHGRDGNDECRHSGSGHDRDFQAHASTSFVGPKPR